MEMNRILEAHRAKHKAFQLERQLAGVRAEAHKLAIMSRFPATVAIEYKPTYFVRPERYRLPHLMAWKRWLESRLGAFTHQNVVKVLCICCGIPIDASSGYKTYIGAREKKTLEASKESKVTVGAIVKWDEKETIDRLPPYDGDMEDEVVKTEVIRIVTHTALGCPACQLHFLRVKADMDRAYQSELNTYTRKAQLIAEYKALVTNPNPDMVRLGESPRVKTAFILVDPKEIQEELTVAYWKGRE